MFVYGIHKHNDSSKSFPGSSSLISASSIDPLRAHYAIQAFLGHAAVVAVSGCSPYMYM